MSFVLSGGMGDGGEGGGAADISPPLITNITPAPGTPLNPTQSIQVDVTDPGGTLARLMLLLRWEPGDDDEEPDTELRCIYDGEVFDEPYADSTVSEIADGFRFVLSRTGGWLAPISLHPVALDTGGNLGEVDD